MQSVTVIILIIIMMMIIMMTVMMIIMIIILIKLCINSNSADTTNNAVQLMMSYVHADQVLSLQLGLRKQKHTCSPGHTRSWQFWHQHRAAA